MDQQQSTAYSTDPEQEVGEEQSVAYSVDTAKVAEGQAPVASVATSNAGYHDDGFDDDERCAYQGVRAPMDLNGSPGLVLLLSDLC